MGFGLLVSVEERCLAEHEDPLACLVNMCVVEVGSSCFNQRSLSGRDGFYRTISDSTHVGGRVG